VRFWPPCTECQQACQGPRVRHATAIYTLLPRKVLLLTYSLPCWHAILCMHLVVVGLWLYCLQQGIVTQRCLGSTHSQGPGWAIPCVELFCLRLETGLGTGWTSVHCQDHRYVPQNSHAPPVCAGCLLWLFQAEGGCSLAVPPGCLELPGKPAMCQAGTHGLSMCRQPTTRLVAGMLRACACCQGFCCSARSFA
jgi:hypothetical protein